MRLPFDLRRGERRPAAALLLPDDVEAVLRLCARACAVTICPVAGGFLLRLPAATEADFPGAIRLRALSENLFVPADADLTPALLEDEARSLVRRRGLVFLPAGRVLAVEPQTTLEPADLVHLPRLPRRTWRPFPEAPRRPEQLHEVILDLPDPPAGLFLEEQGGDVGTDPIEHPQIGSLRETSGRAKAMLGQGLFWLGSKLGLKQLASLGASLVQKAIEQAPRISERVLGKQESALRELLRQFKTGKIEDALRRALPLGSSTPRGAVPAQDANLPTHGLAYRLADFLGLPRGGAGVWLGGSSVYDELQREYRKCADDAIRRGDFLRAAVIYGKLLEDWWRMAAMLTRAGLHHDAAMVYLQRLKDDIQAARAFESAGEFDRALEIYLRRGDHLAAGDLLRRIGEPERAVEQFLKAAELEASRHNFSAAAKLLLARAGRPDLAEKYLIAGWENRPAAEAVGCLNELREMYAHRQDRAKLLKLLDEAEEYFAEPGEDHTAGQFAGGLMALAGDVKYRDLADDLRDRALRITARKLQQRGRVGDRSSAVVSMLFGGPLWEPALVRDAEVALRGLGAAQTPRREARRIPTRQAVVTAACSALETGDVFLGFEDGGFVHLQAQVGIPAVIKWDNPVTAISCDTTGEFVVVLQRDGRGDYVCSSRRMNPSDGVQSAHLAARSMKGVPGLSNVATCGREKIVILWDGETREYLAVPRLTPEVTEETSEGQQSVFLLCQFNPIQVRRSTVIFDLDRFACLAHTVPHTLQFAPVPWVACGSRLAGLPWLATRLVDRTQLEVVTVTSEQQVCWATLKVFTHDHGVLSSCRTKERTRFLAGTVLASGLVAGVHREGVSWYRPGRDQLRLVTQTRTDVADAVACFDSPPTRELLVVCRLGDVVGVPVPE